MLLSCGNIMTLRKIVVNLLAHPSSWKNPRLGIGEAPLEICHRACIGTLLSQIRRVCNIDLLIRSPCSHNQVGHNTNRELLSSPKIGAPFPFPSIGCPLENCDSRFKTAANVAAQRVLIARKLSLIFKSLSEADDTTRKSHRHPRPSDLLYTTR
jgi:hypothetical protein